MFLRLSLLVLLFSTQAFAVKFKVKSVPGEYIVKMRYQKNNFKINKNFKKSLFSIFKNSTSPKIEEFRTDTKLLLIKIAPSSTALSNQEIIEKLKLLPEVEYAEPNYYVYTSSEPNDPDFAIQYALKNTGQTDRKGQVGIAGKDINVVPLWNQGFYGDKKTIVAIIDTGIDFQHPDLAQNIYVNPGEAGAKSNNKIDDDGNGFIDDVQGWNFHSNNNSPADDMGHGSHVSGIIGGVANNSYGISGVAWNVSLLPIKVMNDQGSGSVSNCIEGINYARTMHAKIMNQSWGTYAYSQALEEAMAKSEDDGILSVVSAGNDTNNNDETSEYPASFSMKNIISVAAVDNQGKPADWTNYGRGSVHIAAPGVWIYSAIQGGKYIYAAGTSMAAPHVTGAAVLLMSAHPEWSYKEVIQRLTSTCDREDILKNMVRCGGRLNVYNAMYSISPPSMDPPESLWQNTSFLIESPHPYDINSNYSWAYKVPGAKYLRIYFDNVDVEKKYDPITIEDNKNSIIEKLSGTFNQYSTLYTKGDTITVKLFSDGITTGYGFKGVIQAVYSDSWTPTHPLNR